MIDPAKTLRITGDSKVDLPTDLSSVEQLWLEDCGGAMCTQRRLPLPSLRMLYVRNFNLPLLSVLEINAADKMEWLLVSNSPGCLDGFHRLGVFSQLTRLKIRGQRLSEDDLDWLCSLSQLQALSVTDSNFSDANLNELRSAETLRRGDFFRTEISMQANGPMQMIFPNLGSLDVSHCSLSPTAVTTLARCFPALERLFAIDTRIAELSSDERLQFSQLKLLETGNTGLDFDLLDSDFWPT